MTKRLKKNQSNQCYQYRARVGVRGHLFFGGGGGGGGGGGVARIGIGFTSDMIGYENVTWFVNQSVQNKAILQRQVTNLKQLKYQMMI